MLYHKNTQINVEFVEYIINLKKLKYTYLIPDILNAKASTSLIVSKDLPMTCLVRKDQCNSVADTNLSRSSMWITNLSRSSVWITQGSVADSRLIFDLDRLDKCSYI
jgi:hypothetical protein